MSVTIMQLKENLEKYLKLSESEDILITDKGKVIAKITSPETERTEIAKSLFGILPSTVSIEEAKEGRLSN